jgi:hypothetical protein
MIHLFIMLSLAAGAPQQGVRLSESQSKAVRAYAHELVKLRSRSQGASLERLFNAAVEIRALFGGSSPDQPSIEDLSAGDFAKLEHTLSGIILNRGEVILAEPDPHFFSELSSEYGGFVDRSFFELFSKTYPDGVWPVYLTQQTDYSGCTEFGEGHLVRSYREWSRFRTSHPLRYQREVKRIIDQIQEQIVSTCACGDRDSVLRELREFAAAFPKSPVHKAVKDRIKELEEGSSDVRFQCISG